MTATQTRAMIVLDGDMFAIPLFLKIDASVTEGEAELPVAPGALLEAAEAGLTLIGIST